MFRSRWQLFRVLGIPVSLDLSWLVILALITWTLVGVFQEEVPGLSLTAYGLIGLATALAFFTCIVLHEFGHAIVAKMLGTRIRGITLFLFGGVAEMEGEPASAGNEFAIAIAGPAVSAVLAVVFTLASAATEIAAVAMPLRYLAQINLTVMVFNLVPAFPLDGGRVLRSVLWGVTGDVRRATYWAALLGQGFAWVLIGGGGLLILSGMFFQGIWMVLIGFFLNSAARGSYEQVLMRQTLRGERVSRFMTHHPIVVSPEADLRSWVEDYVYRHHRKMFPVVANEHVAGVIRTEALAKFPREEWHRHAVAEAMDTDVRAVSIAPDADALHALEKMQRSRSSRLLVMDGDHLVGVVSLKDLLNFLNLKLELDDVKSRQS
jgi:Zn-dependent protease/CBS domain-containing protein